MWPFKRKPKNIPPPPSLNELHSYAEPQEPYPSAQPAGSPTYATTLGPTFPSIPNQDKILVHWYRPPGDENPDAWWEDIASDDTYRSSVEDIHGTPVPSLTREIRRGDDPRWSPPSMSRLTNYLAPTNGYSMTRPYDQDVARELNGDHFSMADNRRTFSIGGQNPVHRGRNTYRLTPPSLDATSVDLAGTQQPESPAGIYVSPQAPIARRAYRLG